ALQEIVWLISGPPGRGIPLRAGSLVTFFSEGGLVDPSLRGSSCILVQLSGGGVPVLVQLRPSNKALSVHLFSEAGVASLSFTARIERPPPHRGGSASKKDGLAAPSSPSFLGRALREQRTDTGALPTFHVLRARGISLAAPLFLGFASPLPHLTSAETGTPFSFFIQYRIHSCRLERYGVISSGSFCRGAGRIAARSAASSEVKSMADFPK